MDDIYNGTRSRLNKYSTDAYNGLTELKKKIRNKRKNDSSHDVQQQSSVTTTTVPDEIPDWVTNPTAYT